ncbi:hypothetical protein [Nonomuraea harbinensis]|uniref:Uncharacterized protein n=1 Tax=Nonomuraea harbinensis TaxID=1286938 RepID=A0ABW1BR93_9ACTN|nr:hypothetical protein [Nonomuraea harbinensis]
MLLEEAPAPRRAGPLTQLITRLLDKDPRRRPTVAEALTMAGAQPATKVHVRSDTTRPKAWQLMGVAALMAIITAVDVAGLPDAGGTWEHFEHYGDDAVLSVAVLIVAVADVVLAGLLCAGLAWFLPVRAGKTVTALVGVAGFVFGCGAAAFAFHGAGETLQNTMELSGRESVTVSLALISIVVLVAAGLAWNFPRPGGHFS